MRKTERQKKVEGEAYAKTVEAAIKRGEIGNRLDYDGDYTSYAGECGDGETFLHVKTDKGPVTLVLTEDCVMQLMSQLDDLLTYYEYNEEVGEERQGASLN